MAIEPITENELYHYTPEQLTSLLYEAGLIRLEQAARALEQGEHLEANRQLQTCHDILHRLGAGLNYEAGLIADQLEALYQYMAERLVYANVHKDRSAVLEVHKLLSTIQDADLILVLHRGEIVERGTHAELLAQEGLYYKMFLLQQS